MDRPQFYRFHQGQKTLPFSDAEYEARLAKLRAKMTEDGIDACADGRACDDEALFNDLIDPWDDNDDVSICIHTIVIDEQTSSTETVSDYH